MDSVRIGVINVYEPATGWATAPVAAVGWTDDAVIAWSWLPLSDDARHLRIDLEALPGPMQARWLRDRCEDPETVTAVELVDELPATLDPAAVSTVVEELLDQILIGLA